MKAIIFEKYGNPEVIQLKEIQKPIPKEDEVLVHVHASSVTLYDCWLRSSTAPKGFWLLSRLSNGLFKPKQPILGTELAGKIELIGKSVKKFKTDDQVFAFLNKMGAHAEYVCISEDGVIAKKPTNMTFEEATSVPQGALTALYFLRKTNINKGQKVLVFGASGGVGSFAVQIAKFFGAEVTGVCSTSKMDLVKNLGADKVIDYKKEDFTNNNEKYDVIFDTIGKSVIHKTRKSLKQEGYYLFATFGLPKLLNILWLKLTSKLKIVIGLLEDKAEDLIFLKELIEKEKIHSVVDKKFPLEKAVEAHKYVESKLKKGHVVINML